MLIIATAIKLSFKRIFTYKKNLAFIIIDELIDIFTVWLFWVSFFALDLNLAGWGKSDLYVFIGYSLIAGSFDYIFNSDWDVGAYILDGSIDLYLVRPQNPLLMIIMERMNCLGFLLTFVAGLTILLFYVKSLIGLLLGLIVCIIASFTIALFFYTISCLAFFIRKVETLSEIFSTFFSVKKYPLRILSRFLQFTVKAVIPLAFIATIPTDLSRGNANPASLIFLPISFLSMLLIHRLIWILGRKHYESAN